MEFVWKNSPVDSTEIVRAFEKDEEWSPNTIRTLLVRLEQKGVGRDRSYKSWQGICLPCNYSKRLFC
ncbi:BlaI/MecI/CopY family transcriptional regulator [Enterococcus raffinosus]|nr:BlaI/MecI/CopY family transcriptional regulator [Enterococcus raffinosus]